MSLGVKGLKQFREFCWYCYCIFSQQLDGIRWNSVEPVAKGNVQVAGKQLRHAGLELGHMHARSDASSMVAMETATDNLSRTGGSYLAAA